MWIILILHIYGTIILWRNLTGLGFHLWSCNYQGTSNDNVVWIGSCSFDSGCGCRSSRPLNLPRGVRGMRGFRRSGQHCQCNLWDLRTQWHTGYARHQWLIVSVLDDHDIESIRINKIIWPCYSPSWLSCGLLPWFSLSTSASLVQSQSPLPQYCQGEVIQKAVKLRCNLERWWTEFARSWNPNKTNID